MCELKSLLNTVYLCSSWNWADHGDQILGLVPGSLVVGHVQLVVVVDLEDPILFSVV